MTETSKASDTCFISDRCPDILQAQVRMDVCSGLPLVKHSDGHSYCVPHLPTAEKDLNVFYRFVYRITGKVDAMLVQAETRDKSASEDPLVRYRYDYVWFPWIDFRNMEFKEPVVFTGSVFNEDVLFDNSIFSQKVTFRDAQFNAKASFLNVTFNREVKFTGANFGSRPSLSYAIEFERAKFSDQTYFDRAEFHADVSFQSAVFTGDTYFTMSHFRKKAFFYDTRFQIDSWANFKGAKFENKMNFDFASFEGLAEFGDGPDRPAFDAEATNLSLDHAFVGKENLSFHSANLRPSWFANIDARKILFVDIDWGKGFGAIGYVKNELARLKSRKITKNPERLLRIVLQQLAANAEENNRYEEASKFRKMAMEAEMLQRIKDRKTWAKKVSRLFGKNDNSDRSFGHRKSFLSKLWDALREYSYGNIQFLYRWSSGFGESWSWALLILLLIALLPSFLYMTPLMHFERERSGVEVAIRSELEGKPVKDIPPKEEFYGLSPREAVPFSMSVTAFQRPDPKPADWPTKIVVLLHSIFGPLQAALLALAIRRKFMR